MEKTTADFKDFAKKFLFAIPIVSEDEVENFSNQATVLLLKEECNPEEQEILEYISSLQVEIGYQKMIEYLIRRAR